MRSALRLATAGALALGLSYTYLSVSAQAATSPPATPIINTATATYTDNNAVVYASASNPVVAVVQNAPIVTISSPGGQVVTGNEVVVDTFTVTDSGNGAGTFHLPSDATIGANGTLKGYVLPAGFVLPVGGVACTAAVPCSLADVNTDLAGTTYIAGGTIPTIGVEYVVVAAVAGQSTIPVTLSATISYAAQTITVNGTAYTAAAQVSPIASGLETDTTSLDARLDLQKVANAPASAAAPIVFVITANDGGAFPAHDLASSELLVGAATPGIFITDKLPTFGLPNTIALSAPPTVQLTGASAGAHAVLYYTADITGKTGWGVTYSANAAIIGAYITGGALGVELPSAPAGSAGAGSVTTPQVTFTVSITQPTGAGAGNAASITNIANSAIGGNPNANGQIPILGPLVPANTFDATIAGNVAVSNEALNLTPGVGTTTPGGASNNATASAFGASSVYVGPVGYPQATGSYPAAPNFGAASADSNNDFTAVSFVCTNTGLNIVAGVNYVAPVSAVANPAGPACTVPAAGVPVPFTFQNAGNASDTFTLSAKAPVGYSVSLFVGTCTGAITPLVAQVCIVGAQIGAASGSGGTATGVYPTLLPGNLVLSGLFGNAIAVYTATNAVPPFAGVDSLVTATGTLGSQTNPDTNTTHIDLYPGGAVALVKSQTITNSNCTGTPSLAQTAPTGVCPGGVITYSVAYSNVAPATLAANGAALGSEPVFALNGIMVNGLAIVEDGLQPVNGNTNSWGFYTLGAMQPTDTNGATTFATLVPFSNGTTQGTTRFTALVGGLLGFKLQPGSGGTISFGVTVK